MESELKKQLNKLKYQQKSAPVLPDRGDFTLLFDFKDAKRVDTDTIYELGKEKYSNTFSNLIKLKN